MPGFIIDAFGPPRHNTESSRKHRYVIEFLDPLTQDIIVFAHKVGIPNIEIDRIVMHRGFDEIYLPGKMRWTPIEITFYRVQDGNDRTAQQIYEWWSGDAMPDTSKRKAEALFNILESTLVKTGRSGGNSINKRNGNILILDGAGNPVYKYYLYGCWPSKISPDSLDYSDSAILSITITLQVDKMREQSLEPDRDSEVSHCEIGQPLSSGEAGQDEVVVNLGQAQAQPLLVGNNVNFPFIDPIIFGDVNLHGGQIAGGANAAGDQIARDVGGQ